MHWFFDYPWGPALTWLVVEGRVADALPSVVAMLRSYLIRQIDAQLVMHDYDKLY